MGRFPSHLPDNGRDLSLKHRLSVLLVAFLLTAGMLAVSTFANLGQREQAVHDIEQRVEPARQYLAAYVANIALDPETARANDQPLARIEPLVADNPELRESLTRVREAAAGWRTTDDGEALIGAIADMQRLLLQQQIEANLLLEETESRLYILLWTILAFALGLVSAAAWCMRRWVTAPLAAIAAAADRVSEGDLHHSIPDVGTREMSALARDVERMRSRTVGLLEASERATEALHQHGTAVVSLGDELQPRNAVLPDNTRVSATLEPAEGVLAGDFYECIDLGAGRIALAVVDVSGHGPEAGIFALRAKHLLSAALDDYRRPGEALTWLAKHIGDTGERFLTAFLAEIDTTTGRCSWANAGHPPAAVIGEQVQYLGPTGPLLGPLQARWETEVTILPADAVLLAYTDGVVEARRGYEQFGCDRLQQLLAQSAGMQPQEIVDVCVDRVRKFAGGRTDDDITVVALALTQVEAPLTVAGTPEVAAR